MTSVTHYGNNQEIGEILIKVCFSLFKKVDSSLKRFHSTGSRRN
jgi:hypothetical protein